MRNMKQDERLEQDLKILGETLMIEEPMRKYLDENYTTMKELDNRKKEKRGLLKCATILLACMMGIGATGTINPLLAKNIPILYQLFVGLNQTFFKDTPYEQYAEPKVLSVIDNNIEVIIEEFFCDQHEFGYTYTIRSLKDKLKQGNSEYVVVFTDEIIKVNGEVFDSTTSYGNGNYQDDYTYTGVNIYESLSLLPDQFELSLSFTEFKDVTQKELNITGQWDFETVVTKHTNPYSKVVEVNKKLEVSEPTSFELEIEEVGFTPLRTYIRMNASEEKVTKALDICDIEFTLIDDLGQVYLPGNGGLRRNEEGIYEWYKTFSIPEEIPSWIAIVPSYVPYDEGEWLPKQRVSKVEYTGIFPVVIQRETLGDYSIMEVKQQGEDVIVHVKAEPMQNHSYLVLALKNGDERRGESTYKEKGEIEWRYKDCKVEDLQSFELEDRSERFDLEQMIKIEIN